MTLEVQDQQDQAEVPDLGVIPVQKVILEGAGPRGYTGSKGNTGGGGPAGASGS